MDVLQDFADPSRDLFKGKKADMDIFSFIHLYNTKLCKSSILGKTVPVQGEQILSKIIKKELKK